jgi:hypothetical protein
MPSSQVFIASTNDRLSTFRMRTRSSGGRPRMRASIRWSSAIRRSASAAIGVAVAWWKMGTLSRNTMRNTNFNPNSARS